MRNYQKFHINSIKFFLCGFNNAFDLVGTSKVADYSSDYHESPTLLKGSAIRLRMGFNESGPYSSWKNYNLYGSDFFSGIESESFWMEATARLHSYYTVYNQIYYLANEFLFKSIILTRDTWILKVYCTSHLIIQVRKIQIGYNLLNNF